MRQDREIDKEKQGKIQKWEFREGPYFEDLQLGQRIMHPRGRTLTEADCLWISLISGDRNQIHINSSYTKQEFNYEPFNGRMAVNDLYILMIVNSINSPDTSVSGIFLGIDKLKMIAPVFAGDTISAVSVVVDKRISESRPEMGIVKIEVEGYKNLDTRIMTYEKTFMIRAKK